MARNDEKYRVRFMGNSVAELSCYHRELWFLKSEENILKILCLPKVLKTYSIWGPP